MRVALALLTVAAALGAAPGDAAHAAAPGPRVIYGGRLQDTQGRPIAGIYPLTFNLYKAEKGGKPAWSETHFVAVDNGQYAVELGGKRPLPANLKIESAWLGIALTGGKEVVREKFAAQDLPASPGANGAVATPPGSTPGTTATGNPPVAGGQSYAALAGFANEAERAKTADAIGDMPAADVKALAKNAGAGAKVKLGATKRYSEQTGGGGGNPYTLQCPPGFIVTGIKGAAGGYVDSLTLICSPLE
ncbi:MAG: hypothetical protein U1F43_25740 [Myxococcota bacterium]